MSIEETIFSNLFHNEDYLRNTIPYLNQEYFTSRSHRILLKNIINYFEKYNKTPSTTAISIELENESLSEGDFKECTELLNNLVETNEDYDWLMKTTEKFCQEKALYNAIMESIQIIDGKGDKDKGALPEILSQALSVTFDSNIGHDFLENAEERYDFYHQKVERLEFDLDYFNRITRGGIPKKTLNIILAGTGVGKTLMMCHFAGSYMMQGKNVLYITMEMAEERIAERIDANLLNVSLNDLEQLPKDSYNKKVDRLRSKTQGKLVVKEYPTSSVHAGHFRHLLNELKMKKKFVPDIVFVDYLNICASSRMRMGGSVNSYAYIKAIAEELRGLAVEFNIPIFSATQTNRTGYTSSDVGLEDTSESFGLPATADFMFAAISTEELEDLNQLMIKQLKNRYGDPATHRRFVVGVDRSKMRLYNVEQEAQANVAISIDDKPVMDSTDFGAGLKREKFTKDVFDSWK